MVETKFLTHKCLSKGVWIIITGRILAPLKHRLLALDQKTSISIVPKNKINTLRLIWTSIMNNLPKSLIFTISSIAFIVYSRKKICYDYIHCKSFVLGKSISIQTVSKLILYLKETNPSHILIVHFSRKGMLPLFHHLQWLNSRLKQFMKYN